MSGISKFIGKGLGTKEVRAAVLDEMRRVLRGEIVDYSFAKECGDDEFFSANYFPEFGATVAMTACFTYDNDEGELYYNTAWELSGSIWTACPKKILQKLSPIAAIMKSVLIEDSEGFEHSKWAQEWRDNCYIGVKWREEKKKISKKALTETAKNRGDFQLIRTSTGERYIYKSTDILKFKVIGKRLDTPQCVFIAKNAETVRKALKKIKTAFVDGASGFNLSTMTAF